MKLLKLFLFCVFLNWIARLAIGPLASTATTEGLRVTYLISGYLLMVAVDLMFLVELYKTIKGARNG